jgi:uncharacterized protein (DUF2141 family)
MMVRASIVILSLALMGAGKVVPNPNLGKAEGACRPGEAGPALLITAEGLKDRQGLLRAELYPATQDDFLQDDAILVNEGKTFRRVDLDVPSAGPAVLCLRVPSAGRYALSILHDRDRNLKFGLSSDGIGFSGNQKLRLAKPKVEGAMISAGAGITRISIRLNYRTGLLSFGPVAAK